jgi:hypothetical protein
MVELNILKNNKKSKTLSIIEEFHIIKYSKKIFNSNLIKIKTLRSKINKRKKEDLSIFAKLEINR